MTVRYRGHQDLARNHSGTTLYQRVLSDVLGSGLDNADQYHRRLMGYPPTMNGFIDDVLGTELWGIQRDIIDAVDTYPRVAVRSGHAIGKSFMAARLVLAWLHTHPNSIAITTAPSYNQVRNVLWRNVNGAVETTRRPLLGRALTMRYEISSNWYAMGFKGDDRKTDMLQGFHSESLLLIIDEAAGVHPNILEASEAILTGTKARALMIGNPTSMKGGFREAFHKDQHLYKTFKISAYDTPNFTTFGITRDDMLSGEWEAKLDGVSMMPYPGLVDPYWVNRQIQMHGPNSAYVKSRVDAEFAVDEEDLLLALSTIEAAEANAELPDPGAPVIAGVDVARSGADETVICIRQGRVELAMEAWRGMDIMESVGKVRHLLEPYGGIDVHDVRVDVIGLGAGLADRLREIGYRVTDVNVAQRSSDKVQWGSLRHEAWWQLKELYERGDVVPRVGREFDDRMKAQLSDIKTRYDSNHTKPLIESKDALKSRTGFSPDRAEAQMLAFLTMPKVDRPSSALALGKARGRW